MNRTLALLTALGAGFLAAAATAQIAAPAAAPAAQAAPKPEAIPAKIALINFEQAVFTTNEGKKAVQAVQTKYEPKKKQIDDLAAEVDSLKKKLQSAPATLSDADRAAQLREIDAKEKQLTRDGDDASAAYNADLQDAYGKVAQKVSVTTRDYVQQNGFTILLDVGGQQSSVMWAVPSTDITQAVIDAYNASSGVSAPAPAAPSASRAPATHTAPKSTTTH